MEIPCNSRIAGDNSREALLQEIRYGSVHHMDQSPTAPPSSPTSSGRVVSVRGSVVDGRFDEELPPIHNVLHADKNGGISVEVITQLDQHHVRGVALDPTGGLAKGDLLEDTRQPSGAGG